MSKQQPHPMKKDGKIMSKKNVLLWILLCCICITCTVGYIGLRASAASAEIIDCDISSEYGRGEEFVMPEGKVSYNGQEKLPDRKYVVFPSGKATAGETIVLSEAGKYELVFQASFDGVSVSARKSFMVPKSLLQVNDEYSSAVIEDGKIQVSLVPDDVFTYNAELDLSTASKEVPLLDMQFNPGSVGTADATHVEIRFTDLYDEENYVTITLTNIPDAWANGHIYVTAGAAHQPQVGVENAGNPALMNVHSDDIIGYGAAVNYSMVGLPKSSADTHLVLYFDYAEKTLYADRETYSGSKQMVVDLDNEDFFGDKLWNGFSKGQVKMSVRATNYQSASCNFAFSTINAISEFSNSGDVYAPIISVNTGCDPEDIPTALVAKPYPIFDAEAIDGFDGKIPVSASVYYKYYSENPVKLFVDNGQFTPTKEGVYVIEYMAEDLSGNVSTEYINVNAVAGDGLKISLQDMAAATDTGTPVKVISGIEYTDASGNVSCYATAKNLSTGDETEIDTETFTFTPLSDGDWEITVTVRDYVSTVTKTFTLTANHTVQPQVYDHVGIQDYFILGAAYKLPRLSAYDFSSGKGVLTDMEIFVTENGSDERKVEGNYIPEKTGSVTVTYRLTVDGKVCEKSYTATVVDVGYTGDLDLSKYFVVSSGKAAAQVNTGDITYEASEAAKLDFVNFVQVKNLTFSFQVGEKNAYHKVNVYLTDTVSGNQVKLTYNRTADGVTCSVNDGKEIVLSSSFDGLNKNFSLEFSNDTHVISPEAGIAIDVKTFLDGSDFTGFTNNVARFSIEMMEVTGASQIVLKNLNGHTLNNAKTDRFVPQIFVDTNSGDRGKGEKITLTGAFVYDTLDPIAWMTLDVTDANGAYVTDENGVVLDGTQDATKDYTFAVNEYGDYMIRYVLSDGKENTDHYMYAVTSMDVTGPTITLLKHNETAKMGDTVKLADTEVTDNITESCAVFAYVFGPEGASVQVTDGKFEATMSGVYAVRYMAFDEDGNYAFASYEIDVR